MLKLLISLLLLVSTSPYTFRPPVTPSTLSSINSISGYKPSESGSTTQPSHLSSLHDLEMKKGKANVPPMMRSQYKQQQNMNSMREQMIEAQSVGADGIPIFNMYVKSSKGAGMWYPCGSFKGDERTKALIDSQDGFLGGMANKEELAKIKEITPEPRPEGFLDNMKNMFS